jgi:D-alanine-D-alanine ligase
MRNAFSDRALVVTGGWGPEREESLSAGASVYECLLGMGRSVELLDIASPSDMSRLDGLDVDFAFLAHTEDIPTIPLLDHRRVPHSGPNWCAASMSYDKVIAYAVCESLDIPVPSFKEVREGEDVACQDHTESVVKPRRGGSSLGVALGVSREEVALAIEAALVYDSVALVEEFLDGVELTVGAFGGSTYSIVQIEVSDGPIFGYEAKSTLSVDYRPITRDAPTRTRAVLADWTERLARCLDVSSFWRADYRFSGDRLNLLDINLLPYLGCSSDGLVGAMCTDNGEGYSDFLTRVERVKRPLAL